MGVSPSSTSQIDSENRSYASNINKLLAEDCVVVFTTETCRYCTMAKDYLNERNVKFNEVRLDHVGRSNPNIIRDLTQSTGLRTVPQIFINRTFVGGYSELQQLGYTRELMTRISLCKNNGTQNTCTS